MLRFLSRRCSRRPAPDAALRSLGLPECEQVIARLHAAVRRGQLPPGTLLPPLAELDRRYGAPLLPGAICTAVNTVHFQGVFAYPFTGSGLYVRFVPTEDSVFLARARRDPHVPALIHLYRTEADPDGHCRPAEPSACGISHFLTDGSGRTLNPEEATCPACATALADGGNRLGPLILPENSA